MLKTCKIWWQAIRFHFTFPTFFPVMLGTAYAILETKKFNFWLFLMVLLATILHHIGLNLADDYYDHQHGADLAKEIGIDLYAGGSGILTNKILTPNAIKLAAILCYLITIIIGLIIAYLAGYWAICLGILGIFSSFYYTAPPLKLAYRGLGEITIWLNFGPVLLLGSYYIQANTITLPAILLSIIMGNLIFAVIIANEIPDQLADQLANKRTLIVKYGQQFGIKILLSTIIMIFIVITAAISLNILPKIYLITWLTVPTAYKAIKCLKLTATIAANNKNQAKIHGHEFIIGFVNIFSGILIIATNLILFTKGLVFPAISLFLVLIILYSLTLIRI